MQTSWPMGATGHRRLCCGKQCVRFHVAFLRRQRATYVHRQRESIKYLDRLTCCGTANGLCCTISLTLLLIYPFWMCIEIACPDKIQRHRRAQLEGPCRAATESSIYIYIYTAKACLLSMILCPICVVRIIGCDVAYHQGPKPSSPTHSSPRLVEHAKRCTSKPRPSMYGIFTYIDP